MDQERKEQIKTRAQRDAQQMFTNAMNIYPIAAVYEFSSGLIENAVLRYLEAKGIDTNTINVRCVLKKEFANNEKLIKAAQRTDLPFVVVIFKKFIENEDCVVRGGVSASIKRNITKMLNNFQDSAQVEMIEDTPLNRVISFINYGENKANRPVHWEIKKRNQMVYTVLDSDSVMAICFKLNPNDISNWVFDFLKEPKSVFNNETRCKEFLVTVAMSRLRTRNKPKVDPMNYIR